MSKSHQYKQRGLSSVQMIGFVVLAGLLLAVVFLLPSAVEPAKIEELQVETEQAEEQAAPPPPDSPWSDAQLAKERREAQEILSKIIDRQEKLEDRAVKQWAEQAFLQAIATAESGDELYRTREFEQAKGQYRESLKQFNAIYDQIDVVFEQQVTQGNQAITNSQPRQAIKAFELATKLKPVDINAQNGLARAKVQSEVIDLVAKGKHQLKTGKLAEAKQSFDQALALDSQSQPAQQQLELAKQAIVDDNFAQAMSRGYAAINSKQYDNAIKAFAEASKIKPSMKDAGVALEQAKNKQLQARVANHLNQAQTLVAQEQWADAKVQYDKVLSLDESVIKAKVGGLKTQARAELDEKILDAINNPQRLSDSRGLAKAKAVYQDAKRIKRPGQRLKQQIAQLDGLFEQMSRPVTVQIKSNNQTTVTLYRFGSLGSFAAKNMELKPGKYTLVGTRQGYRDVRQEFVIEPGKAAPTVTVQCEEKISNG